MAEPFDCAQGRLWGTGFGTWATSPAESALDRLARLVIRSALEQVITRQNRFRVSLAFV